MASKELSRVEGQAELHLTRRAEPNGVPIELVRRQRTASAALCLACQSSGLEDKEIYGSLNIDAGYWSRIKKGEATLQADVIEPFCEVVNNRIYPEWIAYRVGCTLTQIKSDAERELETERAKSAKLAERLAYAESLLLGKAPA